MGSCGDRAGERLALLERLRPPSLWFDTKRDSKPSGSPRPGQGFAHQPHVQEVMYRTKIQVSDRADVLSYAQTA